MATRVLRPLSLMLDHSHQRLPALEAFLSGGIQLSQARTVLHGPDAPPDGARQVDGAVDDESGGRLPLVGALDAHLFLHLDFPAFLLNDLPDCGQQAAAGKIRRFDPALVLGPGTQALVAGMCRDAHGTATSRKGNAR